MAMSAFDQAVLDAYEAIGRTGLGSDVSNIDQEGYDYWKGQLESGAIDPNQFQQTFNNAVSGYIQAKPEDAVTGYVKDWNVSLPGQNYDTEDITAAYRQLYGGNPQQDAYQEWMSRAQSDPSFTGATIRDAMNERAPGGNNISAYVPALEADPYGGRYATQSIYDLLPDAVNVSSINGRDAQFVTPIGQMPGISNFNDGDYSFTEGQYTLNPDQARAQIETALRSGALSASDYDKMLMDLDGVNSVDGLRGAFNSPIATAALGANGFQTGVNGNDVDFDKIISQSYAGVDTRSGQSNVINNKNVLAKVPNLKTSLLNSVDKTIAGSALPTQKLTNFGTYGSAGTKTLGPGNANYQSNLIKGLRQADDRFMSQNTGVTKYGYSGGSAGANSGVAPGVGQQGGAFSPKVFNIPGASEDDIANWNNYSTYRTNSMQAKTPIVSFQDWLGNGGKAGEQDPYELYKEQMAKENEALQIGASWG